MPTDLIPHSFPATTALLFLIVQGRYLVFAGGLHLLFHRRRWARRYRIRREFPPARQIRREIAWSFSTSALFAVTGAGIVHGWAAGYTRLYAGVATYGWAWLPASFLVAALLHETYFYFTHRWIHHPRLFRVVHRVHHESHNPTPWAAFSFHPTEALIQAAFLPLLVVLVPLHAGVLLAYLMTMTVSSVINHLGYEIFPAWMERHWLGKLFIGASHHYLHHHRARGNYGLYFTFWDRWLGTQLSDSDAFFRLITSRRHDAAIRGGVKIFPPDASESAKVSGSSG